MNRKLITLLILAILSIHGAKSQSNFLDGFILTSEKDTLFGKIDNKDYYSNSQFCDFKSAKSETITRFYPEKIYGYRFTQGKYYVSKTIEKDEKQVRIFLEYIIHGRLDIYFYLDSKNQNHFYASKDSSQIKELKYSEKTEIIDGKMMMHESKDYIGILNYFTQDCQSIKSDIPKLNELDHKKMINFASRYHKITCPDEKCQIYEKKILHKIKLNLSGGESYHFANSFSSRQKMNPLYGFDLLFQQSQQSEKVYLGIGVCYSQDVKGFFAKDLKIPISIHYINPKLGLSPLFSYQFDANFAFISQTMNVGLNYQMKSCSVFLVADLTTAAIVLPYETSVCCGLSFDLR